MANHEKILRLGPAAWNEWRDSNPGVYPDLREASLRAASLGGANLLAAYISQADLNGTDLRGANLSRATIIRTDLRGANLSGAIAGWTIFVDVNLSETKGLETVDHHGPSSIGIDTLVRSQGRIPEAFLRGAGVPEEFIEYAKTLASGEYPSCFISHSSKDEAFAAGLYKDLKRHDIKCWFAPVDMRIGDRIRDRLDEAVRSNDKLVLVLSKHSIASASVEKEVETAFEEEQRRKTTVLFPVRLDDAITRTRKAWAGNSAARATSATSPGKIPPATRLPSTSCCAT